MSKRTVDMTVGNPTRHILTFAIPLILANLGQQLYMIADAAIVGRGVGVNALAAVGVTDWSYWMILWTVTGLTQGFSTFVSRFFGEGNYKRMNQVIVSSGFLCAVIGIVLTAAGLLAAKPLLRLLNTPEDILPGAAVYLMTMIAGTLIVTAYNMASAILRSFGDGKSPFVAMIVAASLNIGLDCLFIFVFHWGIFGAALASVLSQAVSFLYCLFRLWKIEYICLDKNAWKMDWQLVKDLISFGLPVALRSIIIALGGVILQSSINMQGSAFIAGYTATNKLYGLLECSAISLGLASCTFFAQNYGAGNHKRVVQGLRTSVVIVCIMAVIVAIFTLLCREFLLQMFLDVTEPGGIDALKIAVHYLTIIVSFTLILYLLHIFSNVLQAIGVSIWTMYSGIAEFAGRVIMAKIVIHWIGPDALFISEPVAWAGATVLLIIPYFYYKKKYLREKADC